MLWALRIVALAGCLVGIGGYAFFRFGYSGDLYLLGLWAAAPLPLAFAASRYVAFRRLAMRIMLAGLVIALATGIWAYQWAIRVFLDGTDSLSGLMVIFAPFMQYAIMLPFLLAAWFANRRADADPEID